MLNLDALPGDTPGSASPLSSPRPPSPSDRTDTALLINLPDGSWIYDGGGTDPLVHLQTPKSGSYNIWVGTYGAGMTQKAGLYVSESAPT